ncbi:MAG: triphosphoribosyl-dephospho-CoA synthase, partial [Burkholderiales bacterium]
MSLALAASAPPARLAPQGIAERIGGLAARSLSQEIALHPKPGLVSPVDNGSHSDMNAETFHASARAIAPYLKAMADAGATCCGMGRLRVIGIEAEAAML